MTASPPSTDGPAGPAPRSRLQASEPGRRGPAGFPLGRVGPWVGLLGTVVWIRWDSWGGFLLTAAGAVLGLLPDAQRTPRRALAGALVLAASVAVAMGQLRLDRLDGAFEAYWTERRGEAEEAVDERLNAVLVQGERAVELVGRFATVDEGDDLLRRMARVRAQTGMAAMALYGPDGAFLAWDGIHRGTVPRDVREGRTLYGYRDRPLFSYLYFTRRLDDGSTVMAAALMKAGLPEAIAPNPDDFVHRFRQGTGEELRLLSPDRAFGPSVLDLTWDDRPLLSVTVVEPSADARRAEVRAIASLWVLALALVAWLLLIVERARGAERVWALYLFPVLLALTVPVEIFSLDTVFGGGQVELAGVFPVSVERALLVALAVALAVAATRHSPPRFGPWLPPVVVAGLFPLAALLTGEASDASFLGGPQEHWLAFQLALATLLALIAVAVLRLGHRAGGDGGAPVGLLTGSALGLMAVWGFGGWVVTTSPAVPTWILALWGLPAIGVALALPRVSRRRRGWLVWICAATLGGTASQVHSWGHRLDALRLEAENDLALLGSPERPDPEGHVDALLAEVLALDAEGAENRFILFDGWSRSGLPEAGTSIWLTIWGPDGVPEFELPLGMTGPRPGAASAHLAEPLFGPEVRRLDEADAQLLVRAPLRDGRVFTAVQPPRRTVGLASPLAALVGGAESRGRSPLTLVPRGEGTRLGTQEELRWTHRPDAWEARLTVEYPEALYDVRYSLELPNAAVLAVRGGLILFLDLLVLSAIWLLGRLLLRPWSWHRVRWRPLATFRARVTLALFAFFLLSNAILGTFVFQTLGGAAIRTATAISSRVVSDAAAFYDDVGGSMARLAERVGAELLEYRNAELRGGSVDELIELGLYEGWIPYEVHRSLEDRTELVATRVSGLGDQTYLDAFARLPDGDVVGTLLPLQAGTSAVRGRELAELVVFIGLIGIGLSFGLALLVGRTLTRPMRTLQEASERVGSGNLDLRLPGNRADEFGAVFNAFNRMVLRIQRARRDILRSSRRTQAVVEEVAAGVVALDSEGVVTLANPRAQALMNGAIEVGEPLPPSEGARGELVGWIEDCIRDRLREATTEFQFADRRIRVRGRMISREGAGGLVVSLEDVTDELRTERVLAWGEMARQVAHEVKNPLTPMKLSVQHIQRAWSDQRADFDPVLNRNAEAILREIDRLDAIARSFSRFGAPQEAGTAPVGPVQVERVAREVLTLYESGGQGPVRFAVRMPEELPPVAGRETEFKEVLLNLLENARAAIEGEGEVVIEAIRVPGEVEVRVRDDGVGIPEELLSRVFEPQFSTRSTGTGLGLAIVKRVVESWGGTVTAESGRGEGTVVRLRLRLWEASSDDDGSRAVGSAGSDSSGPEGPDVSN